MKQKDARKKGSKTEHMLVAAMLSIGIAFVLLAGTTYALFTSNVESGSNVIRTGEFSAGVSWSDTYDGTYSPYNGADVFSGMNIAPGGYGVRYLKITNPTSSTVNISAVLNLSESDELPSVKILYAANVLSAVGLNEMTEAGTLEELKAASGAEGQCQLLTTVLPAPSAGRSETIIAVALKLDETAEENYVHTSESVFSTVVTVSK